MSRTFCCLLLLIALAGCGRPYDVTVVHPTWGELEEAFEEEARTRLSRTHPIDMPASGRVSRILLEPGDRVKQGQVLATIDPVPEETQVGEALGEVREMESRLVAGRSDAVEQAALARTQATLEEARRTGSVYRAELQSLHHRQAQAAVEAARIAKLFKEGAVSRQSWEQARLEETVTREAYHAAEARLSAHLSAVKAAQTEVEISLSQLERRRLETRALEGLLDASKARLERARHQRSRLEILSPLTGVVLERLQEGPANLAEGAPLLILGDPAQLECVAEVLTQDAVKLVEGMPVELTAVAGREPFTGRVRLVEPSGFTKLSSLGIEQQRVRVVVALTDKPPGLGIGYRVRARFVVHRMERALWLPRFALLEDTEGKPYVLTVVKGKLAKREVELGLQGETRVEVRDGVGSEDLVVAAPEATMEEGEECRVR